MNYCEPEEMLARSWSADERKLAGYSAGIHSYSFDSRHRCVVHNVIGDKNAPEGEFKVTFSI